jgi:hypothetical protein
MENLNNIDYRRISNPDLYINLMKNFRREILGNCAK